MWRKESDLTKTQCFGLKRKWRPRPNSKLRSSKTCKRSQRKPFPSCASSSRQRRRSLNRGSAKSGKKAVKDYSKCKKSLSFASEMNFKRKKTRSSVCRTNSGRVSSATKGT